MVKPLCFMVMPYGRKPSHAQPGKGPVEIDFNALWDRAYVPVITDLGYEPVRADQDVGTLIIKEMLERLYFADLVLADMTVPNANVYYEVGIRHAARETGCVLLASDWSQQPFDVAQMRTIRYPLPEGEITEATAKAIQAAIAGGIASLKDGRSPMHESLPGFPREPDAAAASSMRRQLEALSAFQASVRAVRSAPGAERMERALQLLAAHPEAKLHPVVAVSLLRMLVGAVERPADWQHVLRYIDGLPLRTRELAEVREQRALAVSETGQPADAVGALLELVRIAGPTPERFGLLGGRYKRLMQSAVRRAERLRYLAQAIDSYEQGMRLDLNQYYCASNLPRLYRERAGNGDEERAQATLHVVIAACDRALRGGAADQWLRPTLIGAAFDAGDADRAEELLPEVVAEGAARWKLGSTLDDLERSLAHVADRQRRERLAAVLQEFKALAGS
jgi:hypothetical protein